MGVVVDRAEELVALVKAAAPPRTRVVTDIRKVSLPCILLVPVPDWSFDLTAGASLTWTWMVLGRLPADLKSASQMEELVLVLQAALPIEGATATSYKTGEAEDPLPAYSCTMTDALEL